MVSLGIFDPLLIKTTRHHSHNLEKLSHAKGEKRSSRRGGQALMAASSFGICRTCCMLWLAAMDRNSPWPSIILQYCERWQIEGNDFLVYVTGCCGQLDAVCCVLTVQMARDQSRRICTLSSALLMLPACNSYTASARPPAATRPWLVSAQLVTRLFCAGHCFHERVASLRRLPLHFSPILHFSLSSFYC